MTDIDLGIEEPKVEEPKEDMAKADKIPAELATLPEAPIEMSEAQKKELELLQAVIKAMDGRPESEIGLKDPYWEAREVYMLHLHKAKG